MNPSKLPIAVLGAGPVGLAAAAHLLERGLEPLVLEAGPAVGASVRTWGHVRMFSPWRYAIDAAAERLLAPQGWVAPEAEAYPTGTDLVERYLEPLAASPALAGRIALDARVVATARLDHDRQKDGSRAEAPFLVRYQQAGEEKELLASAVIDATGTFARPNPLGSSGLPALGEAAAAGQVFYGIPDVLGAERARYAGRRVLVVGSGHSAMNALLDLSRLSREEPGTTVAWAVRRPALDRVLGGGKADQLPARGELGERVRALLAGQGVALTTGFAVRRLVPQAGAWLVSDGTRELGPFDEIVAATGFRPDLSFLSELRVDLDPKVEAPRSLAPLIDPNVHSCGSVPPHGAVELAQPEPGLYLVGMKSYGRAPTFLLLTGYEQVRSVAAALAGDWESARRVELVLPETGVCSGSLPDLAGACCGDGCAPAAAKPAARALPVAASCCG